MASRAEKMRQKLGAIAKEREEFEIKKRALEDEMKQGKAALGDIRKGFKRATTSSTVPDDLDNGLDFCDLKTGEVITPTAGKRNSGAVRSIKRPSGNSLSPVAVDVSQKGGVVVPTAPRVSDWCYTGDLESMPPIVKEMELYEILRLLGRGAFGEVNLAKNKEDHKLCVLILLIFSPNFYADLRSKLFFYPMNQK